MNPPRQSSRARAALALIAAHCVAIAVCLATDSTTPEPAKPAAPALATGAYFGLKLPGEIPELFAPDIIKNSGRSIGHLAFSPDALECCFGTFEGIYENRGALSTRYENGHWTPATPLAGPGSRLPFEPLFSRDGSVLYLGAAATNEDKATIDFWQARRTAHGWGEPQPMPPPFNSPQNEFCLAQTADGTMYFASKREGGRGGLDLYRTVSKPGQPLQIENLGAPVNTEFGDGDPGVSPDGQTLIFYSVPNRPGVTGGSDLFICFDNGHGGWTTPVNMGEGFNTPVSDEFAATFSQDGRVLFFARFDGKKGEVYWVATTALERFRKMSR